MCFWQRGRRGIAQEDTWDLGVYVTDVLLLGLKELREHSNGYPAALHDDTAIDAQCLAGPEHDHGMQAWRAILGEMIEGFEAHKALMGLEYDWRDKAEEDRLRAKVQRAHVLLTLWLPALWD